MQISYFVFAFIVSYKSEQLTKSLSLGPVFFTVSYSINITESTSVGSHVLTLSAAEQDGCTIFRRITEYRIVLSILYSIVKS